MKSLITKISVLILLTSCTFSNQQKAERLIKQYLEKTLNDPGSYEPVSFAALTPLYDEYKDPSPQGKQLEKKASNLYHLAEKYHLMGDSLRDYSTDYKKGVKYFNMGDDYFAEARKITEKIEARNAGHHGDLLGYTLSHTYRAKNAFGALTLETRDFNIDGKITEAY